MALGLARIRIERLGGGARREAPQGRLPARSAEGARISQPGWAVGKQKRREDTAPRMGCETKKDTPPILLHVIARGKIARSPEAELVARYEKRLTWPLKLTELPETGGRIPDPQSPYKTVLLDERGKAMSSEDFAALLGEWRDTGTREARFILGAADGHSDAERREADLLFAFGPATWPHLLARAMLMEQLYRAASILAGHPYHRS